MQLNCPCCHARFPLEASLQDDAAREVNGLLVAMQPTLMRPLITYIGLFRAGGRQLAWDRAARLMTETVNLAPFNVPALIDALTETIAVMDDKRAQAGWKPLANHNYLKRVLESTTARQGGTVGTDLVAGTDAAAAARMPKSKTGQAVVSLENLKR